MTEVDRLELTEQQSSTEEPRMLFNCKEDHLFKSNEKKFRAKKTDGSIRSMQYKKKTAEVEVRPHPDKLPSDYYWFAFI